LLTTVPVIVTSAFDETFPCRLPPVSGSRVPVLRAVRVNPMLVLRAD